MILENHVFILKITEICSTFLSRFLLKTFKQLYFCKIVFSECFGIPSLTNQKKLKSKQSRVMYLVGVSLTVPSRSCLFSQFYFVNI